MTAPGEWIDWAGGECPVEPKTVVRPQLRADTRDPAYVGDDWDYPAREWRWSHDGSPGDIVRYKVIKS